MTVKELKEHLVGVPDIARVRVVHEEIWDRSTDKVVEGGNCFDKVEFVYHAGRLVIVVRS